ncbi:MAG TPA: DUF721 domain-containing protein [Terriglobales bacterium]|nr:DUF721 domain-containing protein [Terriglobales bacterium]
MEPAGTGLAKIFRDLLARVPANEAPALAWPVACGPTVARRTRVLDFHDGVLRVEVADRAWKTQLMDFAPRYVATLADLIGGKVQRIEFVARGDPAPVS